MTDITYKDNYFDIDEINSAILNDSNSFIKNCELRYDNLVNTTALKIHQKHENSKIVMLCGPSGAGKTTTAYKLKKRLDELGVLAKVVSIDNFFLGRGIAPKLPDGSYDYESIEALDTKKLIECINQILKNGKTELPVFDFVSGTRSNKTDKIIIGKDDIVIFEGIHAMNSILFTDLPQNNLIKIYVDVAGKVFENGNPVFSSRDIRFMRRMLRDYKFRASSPQNTISMWKQVIRGEDIYINPFIKDADFIEDTFHAFEPSLYCSCLVNLFRQVDEKNSYYDYVLSLQNKLKHFNMLNISQIPKTSLIREFSGGGKY
jgi:Uridine kinase